MSGFFIRLWSALRSGLGWLRSAPARLRGAIHRLGRRLVSDLGIRLSTVIQMVTGVVALAVAVIALYPQFGSSSPGTGPVPVTTSAPAGRPTGEPTATPQAGEATAALPELKHQVRYPGLRQPQRCYSHSSWIVPELFPGGTPVPPQEPPEYGALTDGSSIQLVLQGSGPEAIVILGLRAEALGVGEPVTGLFPTERGCGGEVETRHLEIDLESAEPVALLRNDDPEVDLQPGPYFPYYVTEGEPEVFDIRLNAPTRSVEFVLHVEWSSGGVTGSTRIDQDGKPFRVSSASAARRMCEGPDGWRFAAGATC